MTTTTRWDQDEDADLESTSTSGHDDDEHQPAKGLQRRITSLGGPGVSAEGKENVPIRHKAGVQAKDHDQGRRFGEGMFASYREFIHSNPAPIPPLVVHLPAECHESSLKKPYDSAFRHIRQAAKTHAHPAPQPVYARAEPNAKTSRVYGFPSSDTEATDYTNDQHVFGFQNERYVPEQRRGDVPGRAKHRNEEPRERRDFEEPYSKARDYEHLRLEMAPAWNSLYVMDPGLWDYKLMENADRSNCRTNVFHEINGEHPMSYPSM